MTESAGDERSHDSEVVSYERLECGATGSLQIRQQSRRSTQQYETYHNSADNRNTTAQLVTQFYVYKSGKRRETTVILVSPKPNTRYLSAYIIPKIPWAHD